MCRPEQRGSDGRIYAKQVVGRGKWDPWWSPIKWPVEGPAAIYLGQPLSQQPTSTTGSESERLRGTWEGLEPWENPSPPAEGREGTRQRGVA